MRKILAGLILSVVAVSASAQHHGHGYGGHRHGYGPVYNGWGWVAPAIIGGAVVYAATRPPVVVQQPPIVVQQPAPNVVYIDGVAYTKQIMIVNGVQQEVLVRTQ